MRERSLRRDENVRFLSWEAHQKILDAVSDKDKNRAMAGMIGHLVEIEGSEVEAHLKLDHLSKLEAE